MFLRSFYKSSKLLAPYLVVITVAGSTLANFDMILEIYRAFAQEPAYYFSQIASATVLLFVDTYIVWYVLWKKIRRTPPHFEYIQPTFERWLRVALALFAVTVPLCVAWGIFFAAHEIQWACCVAGAAAAGCSPRQRRSRDIRKTVTLRMAVAALAIVKLCCTLSLSNFGIEAHAAGRFSLAFS